MNPEEIVEAVKTRGWDPGCKCAECPNKQCRWRFKCKNFCSTCGGCTSRRKGEKTPRKPDPGARVKKLFGQPLKDDLGSYSYGEKEKLLREGKTNGKPDT